VRMHMADDQDANPEITYGWIGIRITNELDATGDVVGWGYETSGAPIKAGFTGELEGDYNRNGEVDAADYVIWRENLGLMEFASPETGDGNGDGIVSVEDYGYWRERFGNIVDSGSSLNAVPEPSSFLLSAMFGLLLGSRYVWKRIMGR
jgi:hypothetical protein